jgi:DNA modification methylase
MANQILTGDCEEVLEQIPDSSVDLIFTSPPYADQRQRTYGGVAPDAYVDWFLPKAEQFLRVLKPSGTFVLNIKERVVDGERHTYVLELILALRKLGWFWTEEYIWHKKNSYPGKWPNRFRDNWERLLQFNKSKRFKMNQEAVMVPVGDWAKERLAQLSDTDRTRDESKVASGFGKNVSNWVGRDLVYPTNVIHLATECANRNRSATFPVALPAWFINYLPTQRTLFWIRLSGLVPSQLRRYNWVASTSGLTWIKSMLTWRATGWHSCKWVCQELLNQKFRIPLK